MANIKIDLSEPDCIIKGDMQLFLREIMGRVFHLSLKELDARYTRDWRRIMKVFPSLDSFPRVTLVIEVGIRNDYEILKADVTDTFIMHWERVIKETCC